MYSVETPRGAGFVGTIDEIRVWKVALAFQQVQQMYTRNIYEKQVDLIAAWKFDEGEGDVAHDLVSTSHLYFVSYSWTSHVPQVGLLRRSAAAGPTQGRTVLRHRHCCIGCLLQVSVCTGHFITGHDMSRWRQHSVFTRKCVNTTSPQVDVSILRSTSFLR